MVFDSLPGFAEQAGSYMFFHNNHTMTGLHVANES